MELNSLSLFYGETSAALLSSCQPKMLKVDVDVTKKHHGVRSKFTVCTAFCDRQSVSLFTSHP